MRIWRKIGYVASYTFWYWFAFICLQHELARDLLGIAMFALGTCMAITCRSITQEDRAHEERLELFVKSVEIALPKPWIIVSSMIILTYLVREKIPNTPGVSFVILFLCSYGAVVSIATELICLAFVTPWLDLKEKRQHQRRELTRQLVEACQPFSALRAPPAEALQLRFDALTQEDLSDAQAAADTELEERRRTAR